MKTLILAAGYGTRLGELTKDTPKALLDIAHKPLVNHILDRIKDLNELNEVILVTNDKFANTFEDWAKQVDFPHQITIVNDGTKTNEDRLGSIGDIQYVIANRDLDDDLLVIGGDNLFDFNLNEYIIYSQERAENVTIGVYDIGQIEEASKFGVVALDSGKKITSFEEKPAEPKSSLIAMCFYYLPRVTLPQVNQYLHESGKSDKAGDYIRWLHQGNDVYGFKFTGTWYDIGSIESLNEAQDKFCE